MAWQGFPFVRSQTLECSLATQKLIGLRTTFLGDRRCCHAWWQCPQLTGAEATECSTFELEEATTRSLGILSELRGLGSSCAVVVASDSQSVIDHSRRRGHSVASKHVGG